MLSMAASMVQWRTRPLAAGSVSARCHGPLVTTYGGVDGEERNVIMTTYMVAAPYERGTLTRPLEMSQKYLIRLIPVICTRCSGPVLRAVPS